MKNLLTPRTQMVGSARRETQKAHRIIPEGKCDGGGVGEDEEINARAAVFKDVEPWTVVGGNPAKVIKKRVMKEKENRLLTQ